MSVIDDGEYLFQLSWTDVLNPLVQDVDRVPEPSVAGEAVVDIHYSPAFASTMGVYRALQPVMTASIASQTFNPLMSPARWLLVLSFAMRACMGHYTVYSDRRRLLFSLPAIWHATQDCLPDALPPLVEADNKTKKGSSESDSDTEEQRQQKYKDLISHWIPRKSDLAFPHGSEQPSPWRAIRWELSAMGCFSRMYSKNFQIWHHRKELIQHGLLCIPTSRVSDVLCSEAAFSQYLRDEHGVVFSEVDERVIIDDILFGSESKNYHVWLYRAWLVDALPFLVQPPQWGEWESFLASERSHVSGPFTTRAGVFEHSIPACPLRDELLMTAQHINIDRLNNSAWCHRLCIFKRYLVSHLLQQYALQHQEGGNAHPHMSLTTLLDILYTVCRLEIDAAVQLALDDPCNECPFEHAHAIAGLFQSAVLRLRLFHVDEARHAALLLSDPLTPVAAACRTHSVDSDGVAHWDASMECLHGMHKHISWSDYIASFQLSWYLLGALHASVRPKVEALQKHIAYALSGDSGEEALRYFYENGSQFMLDNFHLWRSAQYRVCFSFLEQTWLLYWSQPERQLVCAARSAKDYALDGVTSEHLSSSAWFDTNDAHNFRWGTEELSGVASASEFFLEKEAMGLFLAKHLAMEDVIRSKYWKNEIVTLLYRKY